MQLNQGLQLLGNEFACSNSSMGVFIVLRLAIGTWRHYLVALSTAGGETEVGSLNLTEVESELAMI